MSPSTYYIPILSIFTFHTHLNGKNWILTHFSILYHHPQFAQNIFTLKLYIKGQNMSPSPYYILILSILTLYTHLNGKNRI